MTDKRWDAEAECANPIYDPEQLWWADDNHKNRDGIDRAKTICNTVCTVREQCLVAAVMGGEDQFIWGGMTPRERKRLTR